MSSLSNQDDGKGRELILISQQTKTMLEKKKSGSEQLLLKHDSNHMMKETSQKLVPRLKTHQLRIQKQSKYNLRHVAEPEFTQKRIRLASVLTGLMVL